LAGATIRRDEGMPQRLLPAPRDWRIPKPRELPERLTLDA
jgi:hypothetical protein